MQEIAKSLVADGFYIYPLNENTKIPLKGSHGYKDASHETAHWLTNPKYNIGLSLKANHMVVVDADINHEENVNGIDNLKQLLIDHKANSFISGTYVEKTPRGGLHIFFRLPSGVELKNKTGFIPGVDIVTTGIPIAPSVIDGWAYERISELNINQTNVLPQWLTNMLTTTHNQGYSKFVPQGKTWTGKLLDRIVAGSGTGNRNVWLTSVGGSILTTGAEPETAYSLLVFINQTYLDEPVSDSELNTIFKSVVQMELQRKEVINNA